MRSAASRLGRFGQQRPGVEQAFAGFHLRFAAGGTDALDRPVRVG